MFLGLASSTSYSQVCCGELILSCDSLFYYNDILYTGKCISNWANGHLYEIQSFENGKEYGPCTYFRRNESHLFEVMVKNGINHGINTYWYRNGNLKKQMIYKNGDFIDILALYFKDGNLKYKLDTATNTVYYYYRNRKIKKEYNYDRNKNIVYCIEKGPFEYRRNGKKFRVIAIDKDVDNKILWGVLSIHSYGTKILKVEVNE